MSKKGSARGEIDLTFKVSGDPSDFDFEELNYSLRQNGVAVFDRDGMTIAEDGKHIVVYGESAYDPAKDRGHKSGDPEIDRIVERTKREVRKL